ncbi:DNA adenine methylase [Natroniella acetigena]|uniref:DNA adenine methylase n=1 Tax=Natroniella acetigena TaxID=52004 RepID=UPI00200A3C12|nr:DNA adenine methylase [Natroniella acetigena]MCK8827636.1 DNA adenine methylase [Natroniella acetigena]
MAGNVVIKLDDNGLLDAKPFLKWVGGKRQLLDEIEARLPKKIVESRQIDKYVEPFVGGGAVFFFLKNHFDVKESIICDVNRELIVGYKTIKNNPQELIEKLSSIENKYLTLSRENDERKEFYYEIRDLYNKEMLDFDYENYNEGWIERSKYLIFLNKTCFNGMFRQNKKGEFNVPHGRYANPTICDSENILKVSKALQDTKIICGDFTETEDYIDEGAFVYFDPPYRPLDDTSNFTGYFKGGFDDSDQQKLAEFFSEMDNKGADLLLSNSDPKNVDPKDDFFEELYCGYNIERVQARRSINSKGSKRGAINELMISN